MSERDMRALQKLLADRLGLQWTDVVEWLRSQHSLDEVEQLFRARRLEDVLQDVQHAAEKFAADINNAYLLSGQRAAEWLDARVPDALIRFDATSPALVARAKQNQLEQVYGLTQEARVNMQQAFVDARLTGENPRVTAQRIRDGLGLAPNQEQAVANYRRSLEQGNWSRALGYELSDGHGDRTVRRLQRDGGALTPGQVEDLSERYRQNAITARAETIARTESLEAAHGGAHGLMDQAISRGEVRADQLQREWMHGPVRQDSRKDHVEMDGVTVRYGEDYVLPDGTKMKHPGDRRGGVKHCANCTCCEATTYVADA